MNRLVKAELYRFFHASRFKTYLLIFMIITAIMPLLSNLECPNLTLDYASAVCVEISVIPMLVAPIFLTIITGMAYQNKTAYYEVMAGNKISHIILSKVLVEGVIVAAGIFISFCIIPMIAFCRNGAGEMEHIWLRFLLIAIIIFRLCMSGVLITTAIRHIAGAGALSFVRFYVLEGILMVSVELLLEFEVFTEESSKITQWFVANQIGIAMLGEINAGFVIAVLGSLLIEGIIWYTISYVGMRKKKYY